MNILLVDDNDILRHLGKETLSLLGQKVDTASSGEQALQKSNEKRYDLIFLDINMPSLDGYQTLMSLRENGFFKPIVAVSADPLEKSKCKKMGFNSFLDKPYGFNQMKAFINSFILPC